MKILFFACAVCFGDPTSLMSRGAFWGAVVMVGVVAVVLSAIGGIAFSWSRRARSLEVNGHGKASSR